MQNNNFSWVIFCVFLCLGIIVTNYLKICFPFLYVVALVILTLSFVFIRNNKISTVFIYILAFILGNLTFLNQSTFHRNHLKNLGIPLSSKIKVKGTILDYPRVFPGYTEFSFYLKEIINKDISYPATGKILVKVFKKGDFLYLDDLILEGRFYIPYYRNYRDCLKRKNIYGILRVDRNNRVIYLEKTKTFFLKFWIYKLRGSIKEIFQNNLLPFSSSILDAIILGDRTQVSFYVWDTFLKVGTVHILAISGLHIGIVCFVFLLTLKILRIPRSLRFILVIFILSIYCILTGASPSVLRATLMGIILLGAKIFKREIDIYNCLAFACIFILIFWPQQIFEISFQLSFVSVLSIILFFPLIKSMLGEPLYKNGLSRLLVLNFYISICSFLGVFPLVAYYFKIIPSVAIFANLAIIPYMGLVVASAFMLIFSRILFPLFLPYISKSCDLFIIGLFKVNSLFLKVPFAYCKVSYFPLHWLLFYYGLITSVLIFFYQAFSKKLPINNC